VVSSWAVFQERRIEDNRRARQSAHQDRVRLSTETAEAFFPGKGPRLVAWKFRKQFYRNSNSNGNSNQPVYFCLSVSLFLVAYVFWATAVVKYVLAVNHSFSIDPPAQVSQSGNLPHNIIGQWPAQG